MKSMLIAVAAVLLLGSTAYGGWYVGPTVGYAYYPRVPVYAYRAPVVVPGPYVAYSPIWAGPVVAPGAVVVGRPVVVGRAGRIYVPGRPVRNAVRAVLP